MEEMYLCFCRCVFHGWEEWDKRREYMGERNLVFTAQTLRPSFEVLGREKKTTKP